MKDNSLLIAVGVTFVLILLVIISTSGVWWVEQEHGTFGDYLSGTLGLILNGVAVFLIWQTYAFQKNELNLTSRIIEFQNLTSIFFELLKKKDHTIENLYDGQIKGYSYLALLMNNFTNQIDENAESNHEAYLKFYQDYIASEAHQKIQLHSYFKIIQTLVMVIQRIDKDDQKRLELIEILSASLSFQEMIILLVYGPYILPKEIIFFLLNEDIIRAAFGINGEVLKRYYEYRRTK
jgi:hypothetical protein